MDQGVLGTTTRYRFLERTEQNHFRAQESIRSKDTSETENRILAWCGFIRCLPSLLLLLQLRALNVVPDGFLLQIV